MEQFQVKPVLVYAGSSGSAGGGAISGATDAADHQPPFIDVVFCQKD